MIEEYLKRYTDLCSDLCSQADDYTKAKVKKNNIAMKALSGLFEEVCNNVETAKSLYNKLMDYEDDRVRGTAAIHSLKMNINIKKAEWTLENLAKQSNPISAFGAEMALKVWRGEIPGKDL